MRTEKLSSIPDANEPHITRPALYRATARMALHFHEQPQAPSLENAVGMFGEVLSEEAQCKIILVPGHTALRGLRYAVLKTIDDPHQDYTLTKDNTRDVRFRHFSASSLGEEPSYADLKYALQHAGQASWAALKESKEWPKVASFLDLNEQMIKVDPSTEISPMPIKEEGMTIHAELAREMSYHGFSTSLACKNSADTFPELTNPDVDLLRAIGRDLSNWTIHRGSPPFQPIFLGRQAVVFIDYGALRVARDSHDKWTYVHKGILNHRHPDDPPLRAPHIGCIAGIKFPGQTGPTNLERDVWAGSNAIHEAGLYSYETARKTWERHPRRVLSDEKLHALLKELEEKKPPAPGAPPTPVSEYVVACDALV